jgi:hypothetical protein
MMASQRCADRARNELARTLGSRLFRIRVIQSLDDVEPFRDQLLSQGSPRHLLRSPGFQNDSASSRCLGGSGCRFGRASCKTVWDPHADYRVKYLKRLR